MNDRPRPLLDLFLIGFVSLFLELACIRWFGSTVVFLTFFTNVVLLAAFLGLSVGCLAASNRRNLVQTVIPLLLFSVVLACGVLFAYNRFQTVMIDVGGQESPQQIYYGTEYRVRDISRFVVPIEAVAGAFFLAIALMFIGLGQVMGRAFQAVSNRVLAYMMNIAGSLAGIAAFALSSYLQTPPELWFAIVFAVCLYFVPRWTSLQIYGQIAALVIIAWSGHYGASRTIWSPYYKIRYVPLARTIDTNNIGHQIMFSVNGSGSTVRLPYLLNRDVGGKPFDDVLIIGAGSGNDVAAALGQGVRHVDAVEIDPAIYKLGREDHPDRPYADPRVTVHIDDGRSVLQQAGRQYDLIVYPLVDSLVLHSGYSNIRLESFLYTQEAFENVKARLKPGGIFALYTMFRQGWLVGRMKKTMTNAFGHEPLVLSFPYAARLEPDAQPTGMTFLLAGAGSPVLDRIHQRFADGFFWLNTTPTLNDPVNGFGSGPPSPSQSWERIGPTEVDVRADEQVPVDDWPFPYLRNRLVPALNVRGIVVIAVLSVAVLFAFAPERRVKPNWQMFFMGAGFMLLETKSVVHLALLFGSTWMVNSIVFFAILVMILCSNLFVLMVKPVRLWAFYVLLAASLLVGILVPMSAFLALPFTTRAVVSCLAVFVPVFFAGVVFATIFRDSRAPDVDFASNIGGVILGGLSESLSLIIGFNGLLALALLFYIVSAALKPRALVQV